MVDQKSWSIHHRRQRTKSISLNLILWCNSSEPTIVIVLHCPGTNYTKDWRRRENVLIKSTKDWRVYALARPAWSLEHGEQKSRTSPPWSSSSSQSSSFWSTRWSALWSGCALWRAAEHGGKQGKEESRTKKTKSYVESGAREEKKEKCEKNEREYMQLVSWYFHCAKHASSLMCMVCNAHDARCATVHIFHKTMFPPHCSLTSQSWPLDSGLPTKTSSSLSRAFTIILSKKLTQKSNHENLASEHFNLWATVSWWIRCCWVWPGLPQFSS